MEKDYGEKIKNYIYITLREKPELKKCAAEWFHSKWGSKNWIQFLAYRFGQINKMIEHRL